MISRHSGRGSTRVKSPVMCRVKCRVKSRVRTRTSAIATQPGTSCIEQLLCPPLRAAHEAKSGLPEYGFPAVSAPQIYSRNTAVLDIIRITFRSPPWQRFPPAEHQRVNALLSRKLEVPPSLPGERVKGWKGERAHA
jgi:hypothetical protein